MSASPVLLNPQQKFLRFLPFPKINMASVKATLDKMGWRGWLVIERSRDKGDAGNVKRNYSANTSYVKSIFQKTER